MIYSDFYALKIRSDVSGNRNYGHDEESIVTGTWYKVVVEQRYSTDGTLKYRVKIDDSTVMVIENTSPETFDNVNFYASDHLYPAADGEFKDLTFLTYSATCG